MRGTLALKNSIPDNIRLNIPNSFFLLPFVALGMTVDVVLPALISALIWAGKEPIARCTIVISCLLMQTC